jgi:hypothetical protein
MTLSPSQMSPGRKQRLDHKHDMWSVLISHTLWLFVPEGFDGIEAGGAEGGDHATDEADEG